MIKQIGLPLRGCPILLITRMITDRIGLHSVLLPLLINIRIMTTSTKIPLFFNDDLPHNQHRTSTSTTKHTTIWGRTTFYGRGKMGPRNSNHRACWEIEARGNKHGGRSYQPNAKYQVELLFSQFGTVILRL